MRGKYYAVAYAAYLLRDVAHDRTQIGRRCVPDRVGDVQCRRASFYYRIQYIAKKIDVCTCGIFGRKLNVCTQRLRQLNRGPRLLQARTAIQLRSEEHTSEL